MDARVAVGGALVGGGAGARAGVRPCCGVALLGMGAGRCGAGDAAATGGAALGATLGALGWT